MNIFERKISGNGAVRAGKGFTLFISNKNMNDIVKIIKSWEDSGVLIDGVAGVRRARRGYMDKNFYFCSIF